MANGVYISGAVHSGFLAALLLGGVFDLRDVPELEVADVTILTEEEFAALVPPQEGPEIATDASSLEAPDTDDAPDLASSPDEAPATAEAEAPAAPTEADEAAEPLPQPAPLPDTELTDSIDTVDAPPVFDDRPEAPTETAPAPATRVASQPAAPPPPQAEDAPVVVEETAPAPAPEPPQPPEEAAAPPEATTEIVTEAEEPKELAPAASPRPKARPKRPEPQVAETTEQPSEAPTEDAVATALAAALTGGDTASETPAPTGPPLTGGERDALRIAVQDCWVVDVGSQAANVTVTVGVAMTRDGTVDGGINLVEASGGDAAAQRTAFEAARRAILRCQRGGYPLPVEKYDHWRDIEMTFNPEGMRLK